MQRTTCDADMERTTDKWQLTIGQHATDNMQRAADNMQRAADNMQRAADNMQRAADNMQRAADNMQRAADNMQRAADNIAVNRTIATRVRLGSLLRPRIRRIRPQRGSSFVVASARRGCAEATRQCASVVREYLTVSYGTFAFRDAPLLPCVVACDWCITPPGDASWRTSCHGPR